ncbi:MAG: sulfatase [Armatimonadota bacterium]|nr:sulfatase-like hydrolase/transferase [bacterium]
MRILYLDLDTLRPDHLGCYGYHRNTSPNIDSIAKQGVRFTGYHCSDAPCLPSRAALMSGRFGIHTGVINHGGTNADMRLEGSDRRFRDKMAISSLPAIMRRAGLKTVSISPFAERHSAWWFYAGFNEMYNSGKGGMESAEDITPTALEWIETNAAEDNWFLHINYWDPHTPYRAPAEFGNPFENDPLPDWLTPEVLEEHRKMVGPHGAREINMYDNATNPKYPRHPGELNNMSDLRRMIDGYDCGIRYMDEHIGRIFEALAKQGVDNDLIVIISSDHGENLGELGLWGEHATADYPTTRIPMIIRWPGKQSGHIDDGLHYNLDLIPTLAELLGVNVPNSWDGTSYANVINNGADCSRDHLVVSQCAHVCQRGVRFGDWMYIRTYHDGYHLSFTDEMLFDVTADPHQQNNLADSNPEICGQAARILESWHQSMMKTMPHDVDPLWTVMQEGGPEHTRGALPAYCEFLEKTDRGWAVVEYKRKYPKEFGG